MNHHDRVVGGVVPAGGYHEQLDQEIEMEMASPAQADLGTVVAAGPGTRSQAGPAAWPPRVCTLYCQSIWNLGCPGDPH